MQEVSLSTLLIAALAACGGGTGGGGNPVAGTPQASTGFAQAGDEIASGTTYASATVGRLIDTNGTVTRQDTPIAVRFFNSGVFGNNSTTFPQGTVRVTLDRETRSMLRLSPDDDTYVRFTGSGSDYDTLYLITGEAETTDGVIAQAGLLEVFDLNGADTRGFVVFGHDTDPAVVAAFNPASGSVTYSGNMNVTGHRDGFTGNGAGTIMLTINFGGAQSVTGSLNFDTIREVTVGHTYALSGGNISGNGFSADLNPTGRIGEGQEFVSGSLDGNFYGAGLEAVGGIVEIDLLDGDGNDVLLQGGFVAD